MAFNGFNPGDTVTLDQLRALYGTNALPTRQISAMDPGVDATNATFDQFVAGGNGLRNDPNRFSVMRQDGMAQALQRNPDGTYSAANPHEPTSTGKSLGMFAALAGGMGLASAMGGAGAASAGAGTVAPGAAVAPAAGAVGGTTAAGAGAVGAGGLASAAPAAGGLLSSLGGSGAVVAGLGALAGGAQKSPDSIGSSQSIDPTVKPYVTDYMEQAKAGVGAGPNAMQQQGYNAIQQAAGDNQLLGQAQQSLGSFMGGGAANPYSGSNPHLQGMIDATSRDVTKNYMDGTQASRDASFASANAFGGSAYHQARQRDEEGLARQLGDVSNQYRFQDYGQQAQLAENQLGRQMQATMFSPQLDAAKYNAGNQMMNAGNNQFNQQQQQFQNYGQAVSTGMGMGSQSQQDNPYKTNRLASAIGGGLGAYQIFKGFGK